MASILFKKGYYVMAVHKLYTGECLEDIENYLDNCKPKPIPYERRDIARMLIISHPDKLYKRYDYRWTTGRWSVIPNRKHIHYCSRGIHDFVERFLLK